MRAKFNCTKVESFPAIGDVTNQEVTLYAVYAGESNAEDNQFASATPNGHVQMTISNPSAFGFLQEGKSYYLDFSEAPKVY